jgi:hypothetical protein
MHTKVEFVVCLCFFMCLLQEYFKSLGPTQLLAERGREVVVINPGSAFFRIGLASQKEPLMIPHCIARYGPELARKRKKVRGGISELENMVSALPKAELAFGVLFCCFVTLREFGRRHSLSGDLI